MTDACGGEHGNRRLYRFDRAGPCAGHFGGLGRVGHFTVIERQRDIVRVGREDQHVIGRDGSGLCHSGDQFLGFGNLCQFQGHDHRAGLAIL